MVKIREAVRERVGILKEFRAFVLKGNLVDLAVAFVIGTAFAALIKSFVADIVTPLIGAMTGGKTAIGNLTVSVHGQPLHIGSFINAFVGFVIVAAIVFFFIVKPVGSMMRRFGYAPPADPQLAACPRCETQISPTASRCPACTSDLDPSWAGSSSS